MFYFQGVLCNGFRPIYELSWSKKLNDNSMDTVFYESASSPKDKKLSKKKIII